MPKPARNNQTLIVLGTGTEIGKTFVSANIAHHWPSPIAVLKPVITGFSEEHNDAKTLLASVGGVAGGIDNICRWRFATPAAPSWSARVEHKPYLDIEEMRDFCRPKLESCIIVETAGGLMSPLAPGKTNLDLAAALQRDGQCFFLLVTDTYLGSISHTLTALAAAIDYKIKIDMIIINQANLNDRAEETYIMLKEHTDVPLFCLPHLSSWREKSDLARLIAELL